MNRATTHLLCLVPADRFKVGMTILRGWTRRGWAPLFTCTLYAKSDQARAEEAGNPTRDPSKPYGDLPCGPYEIELLNGDEEPYGSGAQSYGIAPRIMLHPLFDTVRTLLRHHEGDEYERPGMHPAERLRPTYGCGRHSPEDQAILAARIYRHRTTRCDVVNPEIVTDWMTRRFEDKPVRVA